MLFYYYRYATQNIELEYRLMPFIPDFIPAVGDIDAFIKVCFQDTYAGHSHEASVLFLS